MKPAPFEYHRAHSVEEAVDLLARLGDEAKLLAGGQSLVPMMNFRLARPTALVDVGGVPGLAYLRRAGDRLHVGCLTRHRAVEVTREEGVLDGYAVLPRAARWVGHYPIRTRGTFGGSIAHADPTAEWCLLALLLDAEVVARSPRGERVIAAADFFQGFLTTALEPDEMVTEVVFPRPVRAAAFCEFAQRHGDFAVVAAAASLTFDGRRCRDARIVLGGVDVVPLRLGEAETVLRETEAAPEAIREAAETAARAIDPPSDIHGSADYRRRLATTLVTRAVEEAVSRHA